MIFSKRDSDKNRQKMKEMMEEVLTDALRQQEEELLRQGAERTSRLNDMMETSQKAYRKLSNAVEDFMETLQEGNEEQRQLQQKESDASEREYKLLQLLSLYQEQLGLVEQWITEQDQEGQEISKTAMEAWKQQYIILKGKIETESRLCAIENIGMEGEQVDYRLHEILQAIEPDAKDQEGTIAKVCSRGLIYHGNVLRKARVAAYRKS